jgi:hypothetical protein
MNSNLRIHSEANIRIIEIFRRIWPQVVLEQGMLTLTA